MRHGKTEDAGGLTPARDAAAVHAAFFRRTLPIFKRIDYKGIERAGGGRRPPPASVKSPPQEFRVRRREKI